MKEILLTLAFVWVSSCATQLQQEGTSPALEPTLPKTEPSVVPKKELSFEREQPKDAVMLDHTYFRIYYSTNYRLPYWVSYELDAKNLTDTQAKRKDLFRIDPLLIKLNLPRLSSTAFQGSGYERGHIAPSADFTWSEEASKKTFYMSNMTPQKKKFNNGVWKQLELRVRKWACPEGKLKIISGPILNQNLQKLTSNVVIPNQFFKVVFDETPPVKAIAFIYSQDNSLEQTMSVAEVEKKTGLLFESGYSLTDESREKARFDVKLWKESDCKNK